MGELRMTITEAHPSHAHGVDVGNGQKVNHNCPLCRAEAMVGRALIKALPEGVDALDCKDRRIGVMRDYAARRVQLAMKTDAGHLHWATLDLDNARALAANLLRACDEINSNTARLAAPAEGEGVEG